MITMTRDHETDIAHHLHSFTNLEDHEQRGPQVIERGEGVYLYDDRGTRYLDGMSSLWCCALGYNEPRLTAAAQRQMEKLPYSHTFRGRSSRPVIDLAEQLISISPAPMSKVFFANSGSEANETAVKLVWYYNNARGCPRKAQDCCANRRLPWHHHCRRKPVRPVRHAH